MFDQPEASDRPDRREYINKLLLRQSAVLTGKYGEDAGKVVMHLRHVIGDISNFNQRLQFLFTGLQRTYRPNTTRLMLLVTMFVAERSKLKIPTLCHEGRCGEP